MDKRGISEVVSYTLLIIIAISMSIIVYGFLKAYVPKDKPECKEGVSIIIEDIGCNHQNSPTLNNLSLILQNMGLFKIDVAFIRVGLKDHKVKVDIPTSPLALYNSSGTKSLNPGESTGKLFLLLSTDPSSSYSKVDTFILEVQPAYYTKGTDKESLALCPSITQSINC